MKGILDFIDWIVEIIKALWEFLVDFFANLANLVTMLATVFANVTNVIAQMPTWLQTFATATLCVTVMYLLLGRDAGKSGGK